MIATVRIAPVERWCDVQRVKAEKHTGITFAGMAVRILTETCRPCDWCDARCWIHERESVSEIRALIGEDEKYGPSYLCEHMLEMD